MTVWKTWDEVPEAVVVRDKSSISMYTIKLGDGVVAVNSTANRPHNGWVIAKPQDFNRHAPYYSVELKEL